MPSNISRARLAKAFNEGRRSAKDTKTENPYENPKLRSLWEKGREQQLAGTLTTPIPPLERGETRAQRPLPKGQKVKRLPPTPRPGPGQGRPGFGNSGPRDRYLR